MVSINAGSKETLTAVHESTVSRETSESPARFDYYGDLTDHIEGVLKTIEAHQVKVVAIFSTPGFSGPMALDLQAALRQGFPTSKRSAGLKCGGGSDRIVAPADPFTVEPVWSS